MARKSKYQTSGTASGRAARPFSAGLYIRLSREDGDKPESESVSSQRAILERFVAEHPDILPYDRYIDDGWSGTDFDRPDFRRMLEDIRAKKVNCVIVKDLSRFGRNYVEAGKYLEIVFPLFGIRFISVNDNIDSLENPSSMNTVMVPFKNIMNDEYCRDISMKVRSSLDVRRKQGMFIGSFAAYGYQKDPDDRHKLLVDEEAAETVRLIFEKFLEGYSMLGIARMLNERGVPNPSAYKRSKGLNYRHPQMDEKALWVDSSVRRILTNEVYIGNLVQKKNEIISYKVHTAKAVARSGWIVAEGTHEPIVSSEDFRRVQELLKRDTRTSPKSHKLSVFAGFVKCADCGRAMQRRKVVQPYKTYEYYACATYRKMHAGCTKHMIRADVLEEAVLVFLNKYISLAADFDRLISLLGQKKGTDGSRRIEASIAAKKREREEAENMLVELYPDLKKGLLGQEQYLALKERYERQIERADTAIARLEEERENSEKPMGENEFVVAFRRYRAPETLTREMLTELVEDILIHEGGEVEIRMKCRDEFLSAMEYLKRNEGLFSEGHLKEALGAANPTSETA